MSAAAKHAGTEPAAAVIGALAELWPQTFAAYQVHRAPLAIGVDKANIAAIAVRYQVQLALRATRASERMLVNWRNPV
jgi:hypothetical protein